MSERPSISVVIPCYNDGKYLPETLSKLSEQTYAPLEVIIVNDGSTDTATLDYLDSIRDRYIVLDKENGRMSSARNHGVKHAKGEIIAALDADDHFEKTFFEKGIQVLNKRPEVAVVTSYIKMFGLSNKVSRPRGGGEYNFLFNNECPACAMVRKSCWDHVGGYDEEMKLGYEDWEFYIRITQQGWKIHVIPEILLFYRQTQKSTLKNDTHPNREKLITDIMNKHRDWYHAKIRELTIDKKILYTESRVAYERIFRMLMARITRKYR